MERSRANDDRYSDYISNNCIINFVKYLNLFKDYIRLLESKNENVDRWLRLASYVPWRMIWSNKLPRKAKSISGISRGTILFILLSNDVRLFWSVLTACYISCSTRHKLVNSIALNSVRSSEIAQKLFLVDHIL